MNTVEKLKESLSSEYDFKVTKTRNFLKLVKEDFDTYTLYVKESNLNDGFWGLNENQIINLKSQNKRWGVVLLIREFDKGYYFNIDEVDALLNDPRTSYSVSDYKIHERQIEKNKYFKSISEFIKLIYHRTENEDVAAEGSKHITNY